MRFTTILSALGALSASLVSAAPLGVSNAALSKRATAPKTDIDGVILNYALTLEHLENNFYDGVLKNFSSDAFLAADYPDWVRYRLTEIASHEKTHVDFLTGALTAANITPVAACEYSFPYTSPWGALAIAQILEGVGTSAYLGAAALITNPAYLTAAGSILAIEARHTSWIRAAANNGDGFPTTFDTPLDFNQVYSMASAFITSCPSTNPTLPVKAFPALTLATPAPLKAGEEIRLEYANMSSQAEGTYAVFISGLGQYPVPFPSSGRVTIPTEVTGQGYVVIASSNATISDDLTLAGPAVVEVPVQATDFSYE